MYATLSFIKHVGTDYDDLDLPAPVPENYTLKRKEKTVFQELEVRSVYSL